MASDDGRPALWYGGDGVTPVHHRSILVVDDEAAIVRVLERVLTYAGYTVITAHDGQMALALARARAPDLVITDIGLPALTGDEVLAALRADPETAQVPVILMSAAPQMVRDAALTAFLLKPFAIDDVLQSIQQFLG